MSISANDFSPFVFRFVFFSLVYHHSQTKSLGSALQSHVICLVYSVLLLLE